MGISLFSVVRRGGLCCCREGGVTTILAALVAAAGTIGVSIYTTSDDAPAASPAALVEATMDDCLGSWAGHASGGNLPPEGVDFTMWLEGDGEGGIIGVIEGSDGTSFNVVDGTFDEGNSMFSCYIVSGENPEMAAEMAGTVDDGAMSGAISAGDMTIDFSATKE